LPLVGPNVTLLPRVEDAELAALFAGCRALVHTAVDDFGMVMAEALAAGKPVLACAEGGALDIVREGETGLLIREPTVEAVRAALDRFAVAGRQFDAVALQEFAQRFDQGCFERRFEQVVEDARRRQHDSRHSSGRGRVHANGHAQAHADGRPGANGPNWQVANGLHAAANGANGHAHPHANGHAAGPSYGATLFHPSGPVAEQCLASRSPRGHAGKRTIDVALAASGLVLAAPLLVSLGLLIPLDSPGPALFRQRRWGLNQEPFTMVKLRTMDARGRVTRLGRLLRPTGLDELPQLWNVIKGDMSLIGPRPEVPERAQRFERDLPGYQGRHSIRPGITGWAQVNGLRGDVPIARRLEFDMEYLREWSFALDGRILLRTFSTILGDTVRELWG
jgi:lipopolysaccharide/colanic/teichoic acid biosynthesis glycosyltransferase